MAYELDPKRRLEQEPLDGNRLYNQPEPSLSIGQKGYALLLREIEA
jgi:hypothetical protein